MMVGVTSLAPEPRPGLRENLQNDGEREQGRVGDAVRHGISVNNESAQISRAFFRDDYDGGLNWLRKISSARFIKGPSPGGLSEPLAAPSGAGFLPAAIEAAAKGPDGPAKAEG